MLTLSQAALYRRLTIGDRALMSSVFSRDLGSEALDGRTGSLVRLAALIVADADAPAYQCAVGEALGAGASPDQITAVLLGVARVAGSSIVMSAAPKIALALGYDVDAALEDADVRELHG